MAAGWECPRCSLVLAPHVAEHRCDPAAGSVTILPPTPTMPAPPFTPTTVVMPGGAPSSVTAPNISIAPWTTTATTGHLSVASGYITEVA